MTIGSAQSLRFDKFHGGPFAHAFLTIRRSKKGMNVG